MASKRNAISSLIPKFDPDLYIGFHFLPTYEDGIRIVKRKNAGRELLPIFKVVDDLFRRPPEEREECQYYLTKLELLGKNKVNRTLGDGSRRYWKNIKSEFVTDDNNNNNVIGWVTKLKLHENKNTTTEWHIMEYRDTERPDSDRWVLCWIYKREKNNGSSSSGCTDPYIDCTAVPDPLASDIGAGQFYPSTSQVPSMNQVQIPGVGQYVYPPGPPSGGMINYPQPFPSCTYPTNSGSDPTDWNGCSNADLDTYYSDLDLLNELLNADQSFNIN